MKKALFLSLGILWWAAAPMAESGCVSPPTLAGLQENFSQAGGFYRQGLYDRAIETYLGILDSGVVSAGILYNIGNCYFKKDRMGHALFYYERALRLAPRDRDILFNRNLARSRIDGYAAGPSGTGLGRFTRLLSASVTTDEATVVVAVFYMAFWGLVIVGLARRSFPGGLRIVLIFLALFFLLGSCILYAKIDHRHKDVLILDKRVAVTFEPVEQATTFFELREGTPVTLLESRESWMKIRRLDGKTGWIPRASAGLL